MATEFPFPCRIQDTGTGDYYYFDGVNPGTIMTGGVGTDLNNVLGNAGTFPATTAQRQNLNAYFLGRLQAFAAIAACESCPELAKGAVDPGDPDDENDRRSADVVRAAVLVGLEAGGDGET